MNWDLAIEYFAIGVALYGSFCLGRLLVYLVTLACRYLAAPAGAGRRHTSQEVSDEQTTRA